VRCVFVVGFCAGGVRGVLGGWVFGRVGGFVVVVVDLVVGGVLIFGFFCFYGVNTENVQYLRLCIILAWFKP
ncbi:hypothetical protein RA272_30030, partial [Pseudomonas syringae pv. tagetis]|uniref:hypothetical protein n=1 Tax=Pseudomonas syringae group genomosp. 7 TaxID=251699 RepID=UPI00376FF5DB